MHGARSRYSEGWRAGLAGLCCAAACAGAASAAGASDFWSSTVMESAEVSELSRGVSEISWGQSQLSDGTPVPFRPWYSSDSYDLHMTMFTAVSDNFGLLWGFGTGEAGEKYRIDPSVRLGFISSRNFGDAQTLSLRMSVVVGGYLTEKTCSADYGAIGGVQTVNCRMSDSPLRPADTLDFLLDEPPADQVEASLTYKFRF